MASVAAAASHHAAMHPQHAHGHAHQHQNQHQHSALMDAQRMVAASPLFPSPITPLYPTMSAPPQPIHPSQTTPRSAGLKRSRPDELDLSALHDLGDGMTAPNPLGISTAGPSYGQPQPILHHHHRLPDTVPPTKMMRLDDRGGAPCVVGQEGMPDPAPRPKGPKLKFTPEDDGLLRDLKEKKNLTWKQIADFFPGRASGTLQVRYCTKLKPKNTKWTDEADQKLRTALQDWEKEKWRFVASKLGPGFTQGACTERAVQLGLVSGDEHAIEPPGAESDEGDTTGVGTLGSPL